MLCVKTDLRLPFWATFIAAALRGGSSEGRLHSSTLLFSHQVSRCFRNLFWLKKSLNKPFLLLSECTLIRLLKEDVLACARQTNPVGLFFLFWLPEGFPLLSFVKVKMSAHF